MSVKAVVSVGGDVVEFGALPGRVVGALVAVSAPGGRRVLRIVAIDSAGSKVAD
jgi:hypothetical protein